MKKQLTLIFFISFFFGCKKEPSIVDSEKRNENWSWLVDEELNKGRWVPVGDETTVNNGNFTLFFCNGQIRAKGKIENGKKNDTISYFSLKGGLISKTFKDKNGGLQIIMSDGKFKNHYATCELLSEGEFKNNKPIGIITEYYKNGIIKNQATPYNDTTWNIVAFYKSGQILDSLTKVNDKVNGIRKLWYPNGKLKEFGKYINDLKEGIHTWYYENGQIYTKCKFKEGIENGLLTSFYRDGTLKSETFLKNGKNDKVGVHYYESGQLKSKINYKKGLENGDLWFYHPNGQLEMKATAKNGVRKNFKWYDNDGKLIKVHDGILN